MIQVKSFFAFNDLRNFSYLLADKATGDAWVIDPYDAGPIINEIKREGLNLKGILNTHQHWDHTRGNAPLQEAFHSPIKKLGDKELIKLNNSNELQVLDTPGHTQDHQVFICRGMGIETSLFSGDTLFNAGVGNCKNGGNVEQLYDSTLMLLKYLPDNTVLYPGHDYIRKNLEFAYKLEPENNVIKEMLKEVSDSATHSGSRWTLGQEKRYNPFFRLNSEELQQNVLNITNPLVDDAEVERRLFYQLRKLRDQW